MKAIKAISLIYLLCLVHLSFGQVNADFSSDSTSGCAPVTINFEDNSSGSNLRYLWSFGNGNISTKQNPSAIYYLPGKYTVSLTVTDQTGTKSTKTATQYITVFKNPEALFSGSPLKGCNPLPVSFDPNVNLGDTAIREFFWDFGDGKTLKQDSPNHSFNNIGKYNVSLLITDYNGCQSKLIKRNYIEVIRTPEVDFEVDKNFSCDAPFTVQFTDKSKKTLNTDIYEWDFGDGNKSSARNPSHTYTAKGRYTVTLTIKAGNGCAPAKIKTNLIKIGAIVPDFVVDKTKICNPDEVNFTTTTSPPGLKTSWDFGDGSTGEGPSPVHTYDTEGSYNVTIYVEQNSTCKDSLTKYNFITVVKPPIAEFTIDDTFSCKLPHIVYTPSKSKHHVRQEWYVNDSLFSKEQHGSLVITEYGTYDYRLKAYNSFGCVDEEFIQIRVNSLDVELSSDKIEGCVPLTVNFKDISTHGQSVSAKSWNYGDGTIANLNTDSTTQTFTDTGVYVVTLEVTTADGCSGEASLEIKVGQKTNPDFSVNKDTFCNNEELVIYNETELFNPKVERILWNIFSDSSDLHDFKDSTENLPEEKNYDEWLDRDSGSYHIGLIAIRNGCRDTTIKYDEFYIHPPWTNINMLPYDSCFGDTVYFVNESKGYDSLIWGIYPAKIPSYASTGDTIMITRQKHGTTGVTLTTSNSISKCSHFKAARIEFGELFEPDFEYVGDPCAPANMVFSAIKGDSLKQDYEYYWTADGEYIGYGGSMYMGFEQPGSHTVQLKMVQDVSGCADTISKAVAVTGPTIEGELTYTGSCPPLALELKCTTDPSQYDSVYWDLGDRKVMVTSTATLYDSLFKPGADTGYHDVRLVAIDTNGCSAYESFPVFVDGPATAHIKTRRFRGCNGNQFIFNAETPGFDPSDFEFLWDLGNGDTSTLQNVNIYYPVDSTYHITLKIKDENGCVSTYNETIIIEQEKLYANFEADSIATDCPPLFVQFKNKSIAKNRRITSYLWEFGDGSTSTLEHPSKLYLTAGKFTVKLYIEDEWGCEDSIIFPEFVIVNGPEGSYTFDKKSGCVPLEVNFDSETLRTSAYEWDMGDGNVIEDTNKYTHNYTLPGTYIPLLILKDSFGCSYTLPPIDTIEVYPYPDPDFVYSGTCVNYPITFSAFNKNNSTTAEFIWEMIYDTHTDTVYGKDVTYTFFDIDQPQVQLTIVSDSGCANSISKQLLLNKLEANFDSKNEANCVGSIIDLKNLTVSDTTIVKTTWLIGDSTIEANETSFRATKIGPIEITLIEENILGCIDTLISHTVIIGDTIPPLDPEMLRVTVNDDHTIQLDYKKSTMADFKSYLIYKDLGTSFEPIEEVFDVNTTSVFDYGNDALSHSYCYKIEVKNTCDLLSDTFTDFKHCTIETKAKGEENRNVVSWSPYIGWDSVATYTVLRKEVNVPSTFQPIGTVISDSSTYIDSLLYCNIEYAYKVQGTEWSGNNQISFSDTAQAMPEWTYIPPPNKLIRVTVEDDLEIKVEWDSSANSIIPIEKYIIEKSLNGSTYSKIYEGPADEFSLIDSDVLVDDRSYFYRTYAVDECEDTTEITNFGKSILLNADTSADQRPKLVWSTYLGWTEPVDFYTIEIKNEDNTFTEIASSTSLDTLLIDIWTDLNQRPDYCYRIIGHKTLVNGESRVISISNEDCSPVRSAIFYPNAFTPDGNGINDLFVTPSIYIKEYHIQIYNRWGELVFESFDKNKNWDGMYLGEPAQQDAYAVIVVSTGVDNVRRVHHGTITLLR